MECFDKLLNLIRKKAKVDQNSASDFWVDDYLTKMVKNGEQIFKKKETQMWKSIKSNP